MKADDRFFLVDSLNPTGYAQVLVERLGSAAGTVERRYAVGDDMLGQQVGSVMQSLLMDGHGSTRQLYDGGVIERYDYDAFGEAFHYELDDPGSSVMRPKTDLLYAGEQWDADLGMQYLRARYYLPGQGIFNRLDPFFGNTDDPQSLHKYTYTHNDPVNGIDPSGEVTVNNLLQVMAIGGLLGGFANGLFNFANGRPFWEGGVEAILLGMVLAPLMIFSPIIGALFAGYGVFAAAYTVETVFRNPNSSLGQRAVAVGLAVLAVFFGSQALSQAKPRISGSWKETPGGSSSPHETFVAGEGVQPQPKINAVPRLPQDIAANPRAPLANGGSSAISSNANQMSSLFRFIEMLQRVGATDIRSNQQMVNALGVRVGINRPDLQFTLYGRRWYIEWDTSTSSRGIRHGERIMANDPDGMILLFSLD